MLRGGNIAVAIVAGALFVTGCGGGGDDKKADSSGEATQTVSFQKPDDPGPDPFTEPADVEGDEEVPVSTASSGEEGGSRQPFGGSGSNRVCDRDKLIKFLKANPGAMKEWARVLGITPKFNTVRKYIAKLHPGDAQNRHAGDEPRVQKRPGGSVPGDPSGRHARSSSTSTASRSRAATAATR